MKPINVINKLNESSYDDKVTIGEDIDYTPLFKKIEEFKIDKNDIPKIEFESGGRVEGSGECDVETNIQGKYCGILDSAFSDIVLRIVGVLYGGSEFFGDVFIDGTDKSSYNKHLHISIIEFKYNIKTKKWSFTNDMK